MSLRCTTHFHACDCREETFKNKDAAIQIMREALEFYFENTPASNGDSYCSGDHVNDKYAEEALAKVKELLNE